MKNESKQGSYVTFLAVLVLCALLIGCATTDVPAVPDGKKSVNFDRRLLDECGKLPLLEGSTDVQVKDQYERSLNLYQECATLKKKLNNEVRKAFNITD